MSTPPISRPWTSSELDMLRRNAHLGLDACATLLDRTPASVRSAAARNRISLRRPGSRAGLILGQPRNTTWTGQATASLGGITRAALAHLRDLILTGDTDPAHIEARIVALADGDHRPVCPSCGARPQTRTATGLCDPCHLRHLAAAHRDHQATRHAQRELWRERQTASRKQRHTDLEEQP